MLLFALKNWKTNMMIFFKAKKVDISNCAKYMEVQAKDVANNVLLSENNKPVMQQVKIIIDAKEHENTVEKWRIE